MKTVKSLIALIVIFITLVSCKEDIIEVDISKRNVNLVSPPDSHVTSIQSQLFWWDTIAQADEYHLQIAAPNFTTPTVLWLDSHVVTNKFSRTLDAGEYEWRVRAENSISQTAYITRQLTIELDSVVDLTNQTLILNLPLNNDTVNTSILTFTWSTLENADNYQLQLASPDFTSESNIFLDTTSNSPQYVHTFTSEDTYEWRVRGLNQTIFNATPYSTRKLILDFSAPTVSIPTFPISDTLVSASDATLRWNRSAAASSDSVFLYTDSLFVNNVISARTTATSFSVVSQVTSGKYFWRLKSMDAAGNQSGYTSLQSFTVN